MKDDKAKADDDIEYLPEKKNPEAPPPGRGPEAPAAPTEPGAEEAAKAAPSPPPEDGVRHLKEKLRKREAELKHLKKELDETKDRFIRKAADMDNFRKRLEREKEEYFQFAMSDLLLEFLSVQDNFERALRSQGQETDGKTLRDGVELIYRLMTNLLRRQGVEPIEIKDRKFDPNLHHAMATEESETVTEPEVTEVLQPGYMLHGRLLRPAMVKVLVPKKKEA